jgi:hypothetical protein
MRRIAAGPHIHVVMARESGRSSLPMRHHGAPDCRLAGNDVSQNGGRQTEKVKCRSLVDSL